jgi:hypothetical protein
MLTIAKNDDYHIWATMKAQVTGLGELRWLIAVSVLFFAAIGAKNFVISAILGVTLYTLYRAYTSDRLANVLLTFMDRA